MTNVFTCLMKKKFGNGNGSGMDRESIGNGSARMGLHNRALAAKTSRKLFALLFCLLFVGVGQMWGVDVTFTFNTDAGIAELGISKPSAGAGTNLDTSNPYVLSGVSMAVTDGGTATRVWNSSGTLDLRVYSSTGSLTFTAPGNITDVIISGTTVNGFSANVGTYTTSTGAWEGEAASVTFTAGATQKVNTITVTYVIPDPYTVTFDKQGGTFDDESVFTRTTPSYQIDEASGGAGITLPTASPSSDCARHSWKFAGWKKTSAQTSTTTPPTLYTGTYRPTSDETLYAVYKVTVDAITTYDSNPDCTYDYFYDIMHGNEIDAKQGTYAMPAAPDDATPGDDYCGEKHFHFIGWLEEQYIKDDGTLKDGGAAYIIPAGETGHTANNKNYYAIWSKVE